MLDADETRRRIVAARILLDISQDEMTQRGHDEWGLDKGELARVERGTIKAQPYHLKLLSELLEVPLAWFTEPREVIVGQQIVDRQALIADLERVLTRSGAPRTAAPAASTAPPPADDAGPVGPLPGAADGAEAPAQRRRARGRSQS